MPSRAPAALIQWRFSTCWLACGKRLASCFRWPIFITRFVALKPMQDRKTDLPVIGVGTVKNAHAVHLAGIALEAGASLIVDKGAVAAEADRLGLFVVGVVP